MSGKGAQNDTPQTDAGASGKRPTRRYGALRAGPDIQRHDEECAYAGLVAGPYRCWAAWAVIPSSTPIRFHEMPARRAAPTASPI